jgi:cytochrome P450
VAFSSIAAAKTIHSYKRPFLKGELYSRILRNGQLDNVFTVREPEPHARQRRLLSGPMSESSLKTVEHVVRSRAELAISKMGEEAKNRGAVDVLKWWFFFSTDVIGELTFGESFRMLDIGRKNQYAEDLEKMAVISGLRIASPRLFRIASFLPLRVFRESAAADIRLKHYPEESIQRYQRIIAANPQNPKPTLFTKLFKAEEGGMPHEDIVSNAEAYIIAGSDTTAHTLAYLVWAVCQRGDVKRRLAEEVATLPDAYVDEDMKKLPYLDHVLREALRLYAAALSGLPREVPDSGYEVDGYWIPGGTTVSTQAYSMHREPAIFPDPER